ncbi:DNA-binding proteins Bright/BRCAA1/RBP1 and related proteins containing BRIGHT domain [Scheffersomyces stipitis CBS 6054]|uniref:DNA-binding proteins Bright/BRCAA1/RBP1 and related proteins containing BRIGHT domain n=1 Tax=Scheffersomyces stipitis (strain ATCC 58785 / CBS 6054 / NBRC 10063 / NRRL Y-11545) TaxID=322104 RepID=A3M0E5_PICST|nr:DNA-binding proteins Bright/BRCAA1/RBP1 and related proteins containing BRIGHT domain [Scheffersomyces stipitis CBS 6054]ABN68511.2 DNA-binding proteins Bright/BRCAA1/RBP1 and related proteins containing BRIGHT domain [Scheffersomyces stipitis CBS 6054]
MNKKLNLKLSLNRTTSNLSNESQPFTPLEQTPTFYFAPPAVPGGGARTPVDSIYSNPQYNESDDILTDIDELQGTCKTTRNYTLNFTPSFDQLVLSIYSHILSLPTTTPFSGMTPPSGLVSKVANETMSKLIANTQTSNPPLYDHQSIINAEYLRNHSYQPIFLQLIRKRLLDLCLFNSYNGATTISVTASSNVANGGLRQSSISNLSLNELNISNYNSNNTSTRSRSSSLSLRKQSLTRNNSYTNNNWLHVGNINSIRPSSNANGPIHHGGEHYNASTDSLQSMQDYVTQSFINRSANNNNNNNNNASLTAPSTNFNSMMMDYQTPPSSNKGSISGPTMTPPYNTQTIQNSINNGHSMNPEYDDFAFYQFQQARSRSSSRGNNSFPIPLTINTDSANIQALNALNGGPLSGGPNAHRNNHTGLSLDSPFMSATSLSEESGYFGDRFPQPPQVSSNVQADSPTNAEPALGDSRINLHNQFSLSEKKRDSLKLKRGIH